MKPSAVRGFIRFAAVGAVGACAHYALLLGLVELAAVKPLPASAAGFLLGAVVNYSLARLFVFASERSHVRAFTRFLIVAGIGLAINAGLMFVFIEVFGLHYFPAQLGATAMLLFWHYAGNALWTFRV